MTAVRTAEAGDPPDPPAIIPAKVAAPLLIGPQVQPQPDLPVPAIAAPPLKRRAVEVALDPLVRDLTKIMDIAILSLAKDSSPSSIANAKRLEATAKQHLKARDVVPLTQAIRLASTPAPLPPARPAGRVSLTAGPTAIVPSTPWPTTMAPPTAKRQAVEAQVDPMHGNMIALVGRAVDRLQQDPTSLGEARDLATTVSKHLSAAEVAPLTSAIAQAGAPPTPTPSSPC